MSGYARPLPPPPSEDGLDHISTASTDHTKLRGRTNARVAPEDEETTNLTDHTRFKRPGAFIDERADGIRRALTVVLVVSVLLGLYGVYWSVMGDSEGHMGVRKTKFGKLDPLKKAVARFEEAGLPFLREFVENIEHDWSNLEEEERERRMERVGDHAVVAQISTTASLAPMAKHVVKFLRQNIPHVEVIDGLHAPREVTLQDHHHWPVPQILNYLKVHPDTCAVFVLLNAHTPLMARAMDELAVHMGETTLRIGSKMYPRAMKNVGFLLLGHDLKDDVDCSSVDLNAYDQSKYGWAPETVARLRWKTAMCPA